MGRLSYSLDEDNRRRLDILAAFGILEGRKVTREQIVNESIRMYFDVALAAYRDSGSMDETLLELMEKL